MSLIVRLSLGRTGDVSASRRPLRLEPGAGRLTYGRPLRWAHQPGIVLGRVYSVLTRDREQPVWHAALDGELWRHTRSRASELEVSVGAYLDMEPDRDGVYGLGPRTTLLEFSLVPRGALPNTAAKLLPVTEVELGTDGRARHPLADGRGGTFLKTCGGFDCQLCETIDAGGQPAASAASLARLAEADKRFNLLQRQRLITMGGGNVDRVA